MKGRCEMALTALKDRFSGKAAAATGLAAALAMTPIGGAIAQDAQPQQQAEFTQAATSTQISAPGEAARWSRENVGGVGVAVSLGTQSRVTSDQVEQVIRRDFATNGVTNLRFFYDGRGSAPATVMSFSVDGGLSEFFTIGNVRENIAVVARDAKHMAQYPELASN